MSVPVIELRGVRKTYGSGETAFEALRGIDVRIDEGEYVAVVGPSGSGKSTLTLALLRCIYTQGTVYYDGLPTDSVNLDALRSNITIIPQVVSLHPPPPPPPPFLSPPHAHS